MRDWQLTLWMLSGGVSIDWFSSEWKKKKGQKITPKVKYDPETYWFFYKV